MTTRKRPSRPEASPEQRARGIAERCLARREHSRRELIQKLVGRGIAPDVADATATQLAAQDWLSEERFAESRVRHRWEQGRGPIWVRAELEQHDIAPELIEQALAQELDWAAAARRALQRIAGGSGDEFSWRQKLYQRGFDAGLCRRVVTAYVHGEDQSLPLN